MNLTAWTPDSSDPWWPDANPEALAWVDAHESVKPTWEELKSQLDLLSDPPSFPIEAVRCAQAGWPDYAPHFRQVLEHFTGAPALVGHDNEALHIFAGQLLAEHRDSACFESAQKLMEFSVDDLLNTLGPEWSESLESWLAAFCHQTPERLAWLAACAKNTAFFAGKRHVAVAALLRCCGAGFYTEKEFGELCLDVMHDVASHGCVEEVEDFIDAGALMGLVLCSWMDIGVPKAALPQIKPWFDDNRIDDSFFSYDELLASIDQPVERKPGLAGCTVAEISGWAWFSEKPDESFFADDPLSDFDGVDYQGDVGLPGLPYLRPDPKVGRNEPCPCGSGKKFKKCCGA